MESKDDDYLKIKNNLSLTEHILSIPIFEAQLNFIPKITIAIPTYKRLDLLKEAIDSAINQTDYINYDIIVVDNDPERNCETEKMLLTYDCNRLSYYKNTENLEMAGNWNRLFTLAKGEYVVMLHDDDMLYPDFLFFISQFMKKNQEKYDAIYLQNTIFNIKKSTCIPQRLQLKGIYGLELRANDFLQGNIVSMVGMCVRRLLFKDIGGFNSESYPALDYAFHINFARRYKSCKIIGYPLSIYRIAVNESCKIETLLKFITCEMSIKHDLIKYKKNSLYIFFWNKQIKVFVYKYLQDWANTFMNTEINANRVLIDLGIHYSYFDFLIYKGINLCNRINFKIRRFTIQL